MSLVSPGRIWPNRVSPRWQAKTLPRPRLDVASAASVTQAAHAYGRIGALSR